MELTKAIRRIKEISHELSILQYTSPRNVFEEKEKFFEMKGNYNPVFVYKQLPEIVIREYKQTLIALKPAFLNHPLYPLYIEKIDNLIQKIDLLSKLNTPSFFPSSLAYFNVTFSPTYVEQAKAIIKNPIPTSIEKEDITAFAQAFQQELTKLGLFEWQIKISNHLGFNIRPKMHARTVIISEGLKYEMLSAQALIAHELVHILRYENSLAFDPLVRIGTAAYLSLEEGLATYISDLHSKGSIYQHAVEYLGAYESLTKSFSEVFTFFTDHGFSADLAWQRAVRIKLGSKKTAEHGTYGKVGIYFEQSQAARSLQQKAQNLFAYLFMGRIAIEDIPFLQEIYPHPAIRYPITVFEHIIDSQSE